MGFLRDLFQEKTVPYSAGTLLAPLDGTIVPLEAVEDPVFSSGMLGKGVGIEPDHGELFAPADGTISLVARTKHAVGLTTADGAELLLHIGIDTVEMNGEGFQSFVKQGQAVKAGQRLMRFDLDKIRVAGHGTTVLVLLTNSSDFATVEFTAQGTVRRHETIGQYAKTQE